MDRETLRMRRLLLGLTQQEVGRAVGVSKGCICRFERGEKVLNKDRIKKLRGLLRISSQLIKKLEA